MKNFDFSSNFTKEFDFPGKNWRYTAISGQIIVFLFKIHHFRTYFLYMIRYNNISRPVHDPPATPTPKIWGSRHPKPQDWRLCRQYIICDTVCASYVSKPM